MRSWADNYFLRKRFGSAVASHRKNIDDVVDHHVSAAGRHSKWAERLRNVNPRKARGHERAANAHRRAADAANFLDVPSYNKRKRKASLRTYYTGYAGEHEPQFQMPKN